MPVETEKKKKKPVYLLLNCWISGLVSFSPWSDKKQE